MCAIAGAFGVPNASFVVSLMLMSMQHRGQQAAGIVSSFQGSFHEHRGLGRAKQVFDGVDFSQRLPGNAAIGNLRYATTGDGGELTAVQPLVASQRSGAMAIVHNGNLLNYAQMRSDLELKGAIFQSGSDTELILHLIARSPSPDMTGRLHSAVAQVEGAWSLLVLTPDTLHLAVDRLGFRPLAKARLGNGWVFASETCAFEPLGIKEWFHADRGSIMRYVRMGDAGSGADFSYAMHTPEFSRHCSFERVYFSRPDSEAPEPDGGVKSSHLVRVRLGAALALGEKPGFNADMVTSVPDSSNGHALAYAKASGIPFQFALIRSHYNQGRSFIEPTQETREVAVRLKLSAVRDVVHGASIVIVDDSRVRGNTALRVTKLLRDAGAREVHWRFASPEVIHPCHWGIDTPSRQELVATTATPEEFCASIGADSLRHLTVTEFREALHDQDGTFYCATCFTGAWPVPPDGELQYVPVAALNRTQRKEP